MSPHRHPRGLLCLALFLALCCLAFADAAPANAALGRSRPPVAEQKAEQPAAIADFTRQADLVPETAARQGVIYRFELPPEVQLALQREDGADLGLFNADGKALPFSLRRRGAQEVQTTHAIDTLYPLWGKAKSNDGEELIVSFTLDEKSRLVPKITGSGQNSAPAGQELKGYIAPVPEGTLVSSLSFDWTKGAEDTVQFRLQTGDDLQTWTTLAPRVSLVRFDGPGGPLESSTLTLDNRRLGKFIRILFEPGMAPASVSGITMVQSSSAKAQKSFGPLSPSVVAEQKATPTSPYQPAGLEYALGAGQGGNGSLSLDSVQLAQGRPGQFAAVKVFTRPHAKASWNYAGTHTFFAVTRGSGLVESAPLALNGRNAGQIRLEAAKAGTALPTDLLLAVTYTPVDVYTLAQGSAPYTLAYAGKRKGPAEDSGLLSLVAGGGDTHNAMLAAPRVPADTQAAASAAKAVTDEGAMNYILWGVLGAGVLLLGGMALQLLRTMRKG